MERQIVISKPKPHKSQIEVLQNAERFNVLANGRRWGKTALAVWLAMTTMLLGKKVGYFIPTFDFAEDFWEEIKNRLEGITIYKSESKRIIRLSNGGELNIFSLEKKRAGRGKKFHRAIIDESAFVKDLKESWEKVIRATLTDYIGDAWFLSSPVFGTYFHDLFLNPTRDGFNDWKSFQLPTVTNPYIKESEILHTRQQLDPLTYQQEYEAQFINMTGNAFAHCFKRDKHVPKKNKPFDNGNGGELKKNMPVYLSFDFNASPMTCIASQHAEDHSYIYTRMEFRLPNSDIYYMCDMIKTKLQGYYFIVTGDSSGSNATGLGKNLNYYVVIKAQLKLTDLQIVLPKKNPLIKNSRILCNAILYRHPQVYFHPDCEHLIKDLELVQIKDNGDIYKEGNTSLTHLLDCWRYYINTFFKTFVTLR